MSKMGDLIIDIEECIRSHPDWGIQRIADALEVPFSWLEDSYRMINGEEWDEQSETGQVS